jgi:hypothetical protein
MLFFPRVRNKNLKLPVKNPGRQRCSEGFNSGIKGLVLMKTEGLRNFLASRHVLEKLAASILRIQAVQDLKPEDKGISSPENITNFSLSVMAS